MTLIKSLKCFIVRALVQNLRLLDEKAALQSADSETEKRRRLSNAEPITKIPA